MRNTLTVKWVLETMYNHYEGLQNPEKRRPVLVWHNKSKLLANKSICFYCSTHIDRFNENSCELIDKSLNPAFEKDTYVWIHKLVFVKRQHFIKYELSEIDKTKGIKPFDNRTKIIDKDTIKRITEKVQLLHQDLID